MKIFRSFLGIFLMVAGVVGLLLSLAGLVSIWAVKPVAADSLQSTLVTLLDSIDTSQEVIKITAEALGATVNSVDALSEMLMTTATTVEDTEPVVAEFNNIMGTTLPATIKTTTDSLQTAQEAARVLESTIQSLDTFRFLLSGAPLIGDLVGEPGVSYDPDITLAETLGELAANLEGLPSTFILMAEDLSETDENLDNVRLNLVTMSTSVDVISSSLSEYEAMVIRSESSMEEVKTILNAVEENLVRILNWTAIVFSMFFGWLLAAQLVILSQGWEVFRGTANHLGTVAENIDEVID